jgi:hypothetical protein
MTSLISALIKLVNFRLYIQFIKIHLTCVMLCHILHRYHTLDLVNTIADSQISPAITDT